MGKREWFVAVADMSGEFAGNPPTFEGSTIFGPYAKEQAEAAQAIGDGFPDETFTVVAFKADGRLPIRSLLKMLREKVDAEGKDSEQHRRCARCGIPSEGATHRGKV